MSWKKHFQTVSLDKKLMNQNRKNDSYPGTDNAAMGGKYSSYLPEVYAGHPQRLERYVQYDNMDRDPEVSVALNTIAEFSTRPNEDTGRIFNLDFYETPDEAEMEIVKKLLDSWIKLNGLKKKMFRLFRNTLKYGDQIFIRDPETLKLQWVDVNQVEKVIVDEAKGKEPSQYYIRNLDFNLMTSVATIPTNFGTNIMGAGTMSLLPSTSDPSNNGGLQPNTINAVSIGNQQALPVDAAHVVHFSLSEGLDANWPFGTSVLEPIFKVYKQKELLEDSIVIYRVQRAPERRAFYIDVGDMKLTKSGAYLEKVKTEIHQKRMPSRTGGGHNVTDARYDPLSMLDDFFFATNGEGRGSRVEILQGGENLGSIDDLRYFNNKLIRGLQVPSSYIPTGPEDGQAIYNDGRVGTAYIQEFRFANYCQRIQHVLIDGFDREFKIYLKQRGFDVDVSNFELSFTTPQNFSKFAQIERDVAMIAAFQPLADYDFISKRFALTRYLGWSDEELLENEKLWREERSENLESKLGAAETSEGSIGLDSVGIRNTPDDFDDFDSDELNTDDEGIEDLGDEPVDDGGQEPINIGDE